MMWNNPPTVRVPRPQISASDAALLKVAPRGQSAEPSAAPGPRTTRILTPRELDPAQAALRDTELARLMRRR